MTKRLFMAMAVMAMAMMTACERADGEKDVTVEVDADEWKEEKKFTFTIKGDFQNPEFSGGNKVMRKAAGNQYMTADGTEMTDLWVVDVVGGEIKQMLHQVPADEAWGSPTMSLTLGTHHVMFLASRGQGAAYADGVVTWTKPLDTFYLDYEVTVVKTSNGNRAVTLNRCATKMQLAVEDAIPSGTTSVTIAPEHWFNGWNMLTGEPVTATDYSVQFAISEGMWGRAGLNLTAWSLSAADEWTTDVTVTSKAGETTNASVTIPDAPFVANRATIYRGNLYSNTEAPSVSLKAEWLANYEGVY